MKVLMIFLTVIVSSCTFHSSQYDFFKKNLIKSEDNLIPQMNWNLNWMGKDISLYAINYYGDIIFANNEINIVFNGEYIYKTTGLLNESSELTISYDKNEYKYHINDVSFYKHNCDNWISKNEENRRVLIQDCHYNETINKHSNKILYNEENLIVAIEFRVYPGHPLLKLNKK